MHVMSNESEYELSINRTLYFKKKLQKSHVTQLTDVHKGARYGGGGGRGGLRLEALPLNTRCASALTTHIDRFCLNFFWGNSGGPYRVLCCHWHCCFGSQGPLGPLGA